jgi:alpha-2-macroglobulin
MASRMVGFVVGNVNWSAPPWLRWAGGRGRAVGRQVAAHPRGWGLAALTIAAITGGAMYGWKWWEAHKPRVLVYQEVQKVAVTWKVPGTQQKPWTNLTPLPLTVEFSLPVAPLEKW